MAEWLNVSIRNKFERSLLKKDIQVGSVSRQVIECFATILALLHSIRETFAKFNKFSNLLQFLIFLWVSGCFLVIPCLAEITQTITFIDHYRLRSAFLLWLQLSLPINIQSGQPFFRLYAIACKICQACALRFAPVRSTLAPNQRAWLPKVRSTTSGLWKSGYCVAIAAVSAVFFTAFSWMPFLIPRAFKASTVFLTTVSFVRMNPSTLFDLRLYQAESAVVYCHVDWRQWFQQLAPAAIVINSVYAVYNQKQIYHLF